MLIPIPSLVRAGNLDSFLKVGLKFYVFFTLKKPPFLSFSKMNLQSGEHRKL